MTYSYSWGPVRSVLGATGSVTAYGSSILTWGGVLGNRSGQGSCRVGLFYPNVQIPAGATITSAILTLGNGENQSGTTVNVIVKGEASVTPAVFSTHADFDARTETTAAVPWDNLAAWVGATDYPAPDISSIIQEIIGLEDWAMGNNLVLFIDDNSSTANAFRNAIIAYAGSTPQLYVTYTTTVPNPTYTYYVDATGGDDDDTGLATDHAWQTMTKVNGRYFGAGDTIKFKRGETWRTPFLWESGVNSSTGQAGLPITFDAYGTGAKPRWTCSLDLSATGAWADQGSNVWMVTGVLSDAGNIRFNADASGGNKQADLVSCDAQGDFFWDTATDQLYMYSVGNPGTFYDNIEVALKGSKSTGVAGSRLTGARSYITFRNIAFTMHGLHNLDVSGGPDHLIFEYCDLTWGGGSYMNVTQAEGRDGNCIMLGNMTDLIIRYCYFANAWQYEISIQMFQMTAPHFDRCYFYGNVFDKTPLGGFEIWVNFATAPGYSLSDIYLCYNVFYSQGYSDFNEELSGARSWKASTSTGPCYCMNNIITNSKNWYTFVDADLDFTNWTIDYNCYYPDGATKFMDPPGRISKNFAGWQAAGYDPNGICADPLFVDAANSDFHVGVGSPVIDAGVVIPMIPHAVDGVAPDMGAYEYPHQSVLKLCPFRKS